MKYSDVPKTLWEPAAGRGWMSWELERCERVVHSSDLTRYSKPLVNVEIQDFMTAERKDVEGLVTNPPYKNNLAEKFVRRAIEDHDYQYVAILQKLTWAESSRRKQFFLDHPPSDVLIFSERINCDEKYFHDRQVGGMICYAWWVWDKRDTGAYPRLRWIDTKRMYQVWKLSMERTNSTLPKITGA
jgi:hypothetical protein